MMKRTASLAIVVLSMAAVSAPANAGSMAVNLVERATSDAVIDTGDKGDSAGDLLTFANDLYYEANAAKVDRIILGSTLELLKCICN